MSEKKFYWLKLKSDFFSSKRIKKLRKLAGGDTYTIIYLKMQLLAMQTDGMLKWSGLEDDFASELALDLDETPENVEVTLQYLLSCGLAETEDCVNFFFPWAVQNTGSETSAAQRMRDSRARRTLECNNVTPMLQQAVTSYTDKDKEKDKEKDKDTPFAEIVEAWNALGLSSIRRITGERERLLKARIKEYGETGVLEAISKVKESDFLQGHGDRGWVITFDWFLGPRNFAKVIEGNYSKKEETKRSEKYMSTGKQEPLSDADWDKVMNAI